MFRAHSQRRTDSRCTWLSTERSDCRRTEFIAECSNSRYTERFIFRFSEKCKWHGSMVCQPENESGLSESGRQSNEQYGNRKAFR